MSFFERVLFGDGRKWVCAQATGDTLEVAIGAGRNLPFYAQEIRLTGIDMSPQMLQLARRRAEELGRQVDLRLGTLRRLTCPTLRSTRSSAPYRCAPSLMSGGYRRDAAGAAAWRSAGATGPRRCCATDGSGDSVAAGAGHDPAGVSTCAGARCCTCRPRVQDRATSAILFRDRETAGRMSAGRFGAAPLTRVPDHPIDPSRHLTGLLSTRLGRQRIRLEHFAHARMDMAEGCRGDSCTAPR
jgi:hypothetical protein